MPWIDFQIPAGDDEPTEREKQQVNDFARRKAKPRFYADENFPELAIAILRQFKADVLTVRENDDGGIQMRIMPLRPFALAGSLSPAIETTSTNTVSHFTLSRPGGLRFWSRDR